MPTLRSHFSFQQFETVLQRLAHKVAIAAVTNLNQRYGRIVIIGSRLSVVETNNVTIRFYAKHIGYYEQPTTDYENWWGFDVEEKLFSTSNHSTKISYAVVKEGREKETVEKITAFIEKLMAEASIKPVPRFSLGKYAGNKA